MRQTVQNCLAVDEGIVEAIDARIEEHQLEGLAAGVGGLQQGQRLSLGRAQRHPRPEGAEHGAERIPRGPQVIDHQHPQRRQQVGRAGRRGVPGQAHREPEAAALAQDAVGAGLAAHQARQVGGDGEAQPGAAEAPGGGGVGLLEGPEEARQGLGLDADAGVDDLEAQLQGGLVLGVDAGAEQHHPLSVNLTALPR
jgi:hypothetical protein